MSVHTKEPWHVGETTHENGEFIETAIMAMDGDACPEVCLDFGFNNLEMRESNARRIVACVNACAGLSTENLESNVPIIELARKYNKTINERDALQAELEALRQQLASSEPVAEVVATKWAQFCTVVIKDIRCNIDELEIGTKLYTTPPNASVDELVKFVEWASLVEIDGKTGDSAMAYAIQSEANQALAKYKKGE